MYTTTVHYIWQLKQYKGQLDCFHNVKSEMLRFVITITLL
jgi:hypothetical protein